MVLICFSSSLITIFASFLVEKLKVSRILLFGGEGRYRSYTNPRGCEKLEAIKFLIPIGNRRTMWEPCGAINSGYEVFTLLDFSFFFFNSYGEDKAENPAPLVRWWVNCFKGTGLSFRMISRLTGPEKKINKVRELCKEVGPKLQIRKSSSFILSF